jgi:hypothetical protein
MGKTDALLVCIFNDIPEEKAYVLYSKNELLKKYSNLFMCDVKNRGRRLENDYIF